MKDSQHQAQQMPAMNKFQPQVQQMPAMNES